MTSQEREVLYQALTAETRNIDTLQQQAMGQPYMSLTPERIGMLAAQNDINQLFNWIMDTHRNPPC